MTEDQRNLPDDRAPASGTAAEAIIQRFGGIRPMANKLGVTASTVQGWKARGQIPEARHELVLAAARSNKIPLEPSELVAAEAPPAEAGKSAPADASPSPRPASTPAGGSAPSAASRPTAPQPEPSAPSSASAESKEA